MIAAVATVLNEADVIDLTIRHLLGNGVDRIYIAHGPSTDDTGKILDKHPEVVVVDDPSPYHYQPKQINDLAFLAHTEGFEWIIPFDADEFFYAVDGGTIKEALDQLHPSVRVLRVQTFQHRDMEHREIADRSMGKIAYRWEHNAHVANGNHSVSIGSPPVDGILALREWQFRSFEHLARKCHERVDRLDPSLPYTEGTHQRVLAAMTDDELHTRWDEMQAVPVVYDPIPLRG